MTNTSLQSLSPSYLTTIFDKPLNSGNYKPKWNGIVVFSKVDNEQVEESKMEIS